MSFGYLYNGTESGHIAERMRAAASDLYDCDELELLGFSDVLESRVALALVALTILDEWDLVEALRNRFPDEIAAFQTSDGGAE